MLTLIELLQHVRCRGKQTECVAHAGTTFTSQKGDARSFSARDEAIDLDRAWNGPACCSSSVLLHAVLSRFARTTRSLHRCGEHARARSYSHERGCRWITSCR